LTANDPGNERQREEAARRAREDAEWQSIIENYGDRPEVAPPEPPQQPEPVVFEVPPELGPRSWEPTAEDDRYVPPPAPPVPRPHGLRAIAWFGLFGVPTIVLVCLVLGISLPSPTGLLALVWFVGGFGYLVATMNGPKNDGGWDDGAVV
jgi:hypothetical protein